jgi:hypothetical protein
MPRPNKICGEKYDCPVRTYIKPSTYEKLLNYCKDMKFPTVSFAARRIIESVDNYPEQNAIPLFNDAVKPCGKPET